MCSWDIGSFCITLHKHCAYRLLYVIFCIALMYICVLVCILNIRSGLITCAVMLVDNDGMDRKKNLQTILICWRPGVRTQMCYSGFIWEYFCSRYSFKNVNIVSCLNVWLGWMGWYLFEEICLLYLVAFVI